MMQAMQHLHSDGRSSGYQVTLSGAIDAYNELGFFPIEFFDSEIEGFEALRKLVVIHDAQISELLRQIGEILQPQ